MLEVEGLEAGYGLAKVLQGVSLRVNDLEVVGLLGPNGAGKSTLLRCISGLVPARAGSIRWLGQDITRLSPQRRLQLGIAQVPEGMQVFGPLAVEEHLELALYRQPALMPERAEEVYETFPRLAERKRQRAGSLSGGERKMLAIGMAMMTHPRLLLLDEPSLGLSPSLVDAIYEQFQALRDRQTTILLVEQNASLAADAADRLYLVSQGSIVAEGPAASFPAWPGHEDALHKAYFGRA